MQGMGRYMPIDMEQMEVQHVKCGSKVNFTTAPDGGEIKVFIYCPKCCRYLHHAKEQEFKFIPID